MATLVKTRSKSKVGEDLQNDGMGDIPSPFPLAVVKLHSAKNSDQDVSAPSTSANFLEGYSPATKLEEVSRFEVSEVIEKMANRLIDCGRYRKGR